MPCEAFLRAGRGYIRSFVHLRELGTSVAHCLAAAAAGAAAQLARPGPQLPQALLDEAQDAVASLYLLLQVGAVLIRLSAFTSCFAQHDIWAQDVGRICCCRLVQRCRSVL